MGGFQPGSKVANRRLSIAHEREAKLLSAPEYKDNVVPLRTGPSAAAMSIGALAANTGGGGAGAKYRNGLARSGAAPIIDHRRMRANARSAVYDSLQAKSIVDRFRDNVVDVGLRVECSPCVDILGITPEVAEAWARDVEERFDLWASSKKANRSEELTFYQAQRLAETGHKRDGEYFVRLYYSDEPELLNPLQFSFVDPDQIGGSAFTSSYGFQSNATDGITRDDRGRAVSYKVYVYNQETRAWKQVDVDAKTDDGLPLMLHGFSPEFAGQGRGFSQIGHALQEFENLGDFSLAHIKKAIIQGSISMYVKPSADAPSSDPFENDSHGPGSKSRRPEATEVESSTTTLTEPVVNYSRRNEVDMVPGSVGVFSLQGGEDLVPFESKTQADSFAPFVEAFITDLAASVGTPVEVLRMKFSENFSASRGALIMYWRVAMIWRQEQASDLDNPVFEAWLNGEIAAGRVVAAGWSDPLLRAAWIKCNWVGPPMPNIDPSKVAKADQMYVEMGAKTLDMVARQDNGSSGSANRMKNKRQIPELTPVPWNTKSAKVELKDSVTGDAATDEEDENEDEE